MSEGIVFGYIYSLFIDNGWRKVNVLLKTDEDLIIIDFGISTDDNWKKTNDQFSVSSFLDTTLSHYKCQDS